MEKKSKSKWMNNPKLRLPESWKKNYVNFRMEMKLECALLGVSTKKNFSYKLDYRLAKCKKILVLWVVVRTLLCSSKHFSVCGWLITSEINKKRLKAQNIQVRSLGLFRTVLLWIFFIKKNSFLLYKTHSMLNPNNRNEKWCTTKITKKYFFKIMKIKNLISANLIWQTTLKHNIM